MAAWMVGVIWKGGQAGGRMEGGGLSGVHTSISIGCSYKTCCFSVVKG